MDPWPESRKVERQAAAKGIHMWATFGTGDSRVVYSSRTVSFKNMQTQNLKQNIVSNICRLSHTDNPNTSWRCRTMMQKARYLTYIGLPWESYVSQEGKKLPSTKTRCSAHEKGLRCRM